MNGNRRLAAMHCPFSGGWLHSQGAEVKGEAPVAVGVWERLDSIEQATEEKWWSRMLAHTHTCTSTHPHIYIHTHSYIHS